MISLAFVGSQTPAVPVLSADPSSEYLNRDHKISRVFFSTYPLFLDFSRGRYSGQDNPLKLKIPWALEMRLRPVYGHMLSHGRNPQGGGGWGRSRTEDPEHPLTQRSAKEPENNNNNNNNNNDHDRDEK